MERVCRTCGAVYRGLACPVCHPRGSRRRALAAVAVVPADEQVRQVADGEPVVQAVDDGAAGE